MLSLKINQSFAELFNINVLDCGAQHCLFPRAMTFSTYCAKAQLMKEFYGKNSDVKACCECYDFLLSMWKNN